MGVLQLGMRMYSERSAALAPSPQHCEEIQNRERENKGRDGGRADDFSPPLLGQ